MEQQYLDLMQDILSNGVLQSNRTGIDCYTIPGAMMKFDLNQGFPAVTTKKLAYKSVKGELVGFLQGKSSAADFRDLSCNIWNQNANDSGSETHPNKWISNKNRLGEDDLGRIYGVQWRDWIGSDGNSYDQVVKALEDIMYNPESRRIIISAWRPDEFDHMALPPCHVLYQFIPHTSTNTLHLCMYQRSCDFFLGIPYNIASASTMLELFAYWTGFKAGTFTHFAADAHIYENHIDQVKLQLSRTPFTPPKIKITGQKIEMLGKGKTTAYRVLDQLSPDQIELIDYQSHETIKAPMAV